MQKVIRWIVKLLFRSLFWFLGLSIGLVFLYRFVPVPITPLMVIRAWEQWTDPEVNFHLEKDWISWENISPNAPWAVVAAEDQNFLDHAGFDWKAMEKAWEENKKGKTIKGASTISQQTAKNVFLWPGRTYIRKGLEAYFTVLIELIWPKERILEVYLNVVEMGNGIYGVEAASQNYYGIAALELNQKQSALLAAILPNPRRWNPSKPTPYLISRQAWILLQMKNLGKLEVKYDPK